MASTSALRTVSRLATRQVLLAVVIVLLAMVALALLTEAMSGGNGGTVYLAQIQPAARSGTVPSLISVGHGQASVPAEVATVQLLFTNFDSFGGGSFTMPTPGATASDAGHAAAAPIVAAIVAAGLPEERIEVVASAGFVSDIWGPPGQLIFRLDLTIETPAAEALAAFIDAAAAAALEQDLRLFRTGALYAVADCGPVRAKAWEAAVADARGRAAAQASQLGVTLGDLVVAQEDAGTTAASFDRPSDQASPGGCVSSTFPGGESNSYVGYLTAPAFDPAAPAVVTAASQVSLAFEIVLD